MQHTVSNDTGVFYQGFLSQALTIHGTAFTRSQTSRYLLAILDTIRSGKDQTIGTWYFFVFFVTWLSMYTLFSTWNFHDWFYELQDKLVTLYNFALKIVIKSFSHSSLTPRDSDWSCVNHHQNQSFQLTIEAQRFRWKL